MANGALDKLTIDRLKSFVTECRAELAQDEIVEAASLHYPRLRRERVASDG
jgi:hypothetical protein